MSVEDLDGLQRTIARLLAWRRNSQQAGLPLGMHEVDYAQRCCALTAIAARHGPVKSNCLPQALVLQDLLERRGLTTELRIAVLPGSRPLEAHAWVELSGIALGGNPPPGYRVIEQFNAGTLGHAGASRHHSLVQD